MSILVNIMNSRRRIHIYNCDDKYLYEIIEDYKDSNSEEEKDDIFKSFCSSIWNSNNKRRVYTKAIRFKIKPALLETDIGKIFNMWTEIEYKGYKSMSTETDWCSLIRQKINNLYTNYFDKEVILKPEYMNLLKVPKRLYFNYIDGNEYKSEEITKLIDDAMSESIKVKEKLQLEKMVLKWSDYTELINGFLKTAFNNCKLIGDYEDKTSISTRFDFLTEDNFYIKYFCKSINGEIQKWQKKYYGIKRKHKEKYSRCKSCRKVFEIKNKNQKYCQECLSNNPYYSVFPLKKIQCDDCEEWFEVDGNSKRSRCDKCYDIYRKNKINDNAKKYYKKKNI